MQSNEVLFLVVLALFLVAGILKIKSMSKTELKPVPVRRSRVKVSKKSRSRKRN